MPPRLIPPPLSVCKEAWELELAEDDDRDFILNGLTKGFDIIDPEHVNNVNTVEMDNYSSATCAKNKNRVEKKILEELAEGNYLIVTEKPCIVSALGSIDKQNGDVRIIHDCSQPMGQALNDYATIEPLRYQTVQDAIENIGPHWYQCKVDLRSAYRVCGINPAHFPYTGFKWRFKGDKQDTYMVDTRLSFGARKSPFIFHRLTQAVKRMMHRKGYPSTVVFLDDFYCAGSTAEECEEACVTLIRLLRRLGFHINWSKVVDRTKHLVFLGVHIDTEQGTLWLDPAKVAELRTLTAEFLGRKRASRKQLETLAGKLSWASAVNPWGRLHLRTLYNTISSLNARNHKTKIEHLKADLSWWHSCLKLGNNKRLIWDARPVIYIHTDSSDLAGGGFCQGDWCYRYWQTDRPGFQNMHINLKELQMIGESVQHWAKRLSNHRVVVFTDNSAAAFIGNKGCSKHPVAMQTLRSIELCAIKYNFHIKMCYIPGIRNDMADCISRLHLPGQIPRFFSLLAEHGYRTKGFWMLNHMSPSAMCAIYPQVQWWKDILMRWT